MNKNILYCSVCPEVLDPINMCLRLDLSKYYLVHTDELILINLGIVDTYRQHKFNELI